MQRYKSVDIRVSKATIRKLKKESSLVNYDGAGEGIRTLDVLLGKQALYR